MSFLFFLFYGFIIVVTIQVAYYVAFFMGFKSISQRSRHFNKVPVSVIVCAKNEAINLKKNIDYILHQNYPSFEIVLINDNSSDHTLKVMKSFAAKHSNIKIVDVKPIEKFWGNKKYALTLGIKAASYDFLLFTDADCKPVSQNWILEMSKGFSKEKSIVLGYGAYAKKSSFLNKLIRFETLLTATQYMSYAKFGLPYMGVGRNLAYRKSLFLNHSGFINHLETMSGDDDLFINETATPNNTSICLNPESFTVSDPKDTLKDWLLQKRRHISTAGFYKPKHKVLLALFYISQLGFWLLAIILFSSLFLLKMVLILFALRLTVQLLAMHSSSTTLNEKGLVYFMPFLEIFLILTQLYIFIANRLSKPIHWK